MKCLGLVGFLLVLLGVGPIDAQTPPTIQPTKAEFDPSPSHDAIVTGTTTPVVSHYTIMVLAGTTVALAPVSVGKPTPDPANSNKITVLLSSIAGFLALPKNVIYTAVVAAVGPDGSSPAVPPSNPFVFAPPAGAPGGLVVKQ